MEQHAAQPELQTPPADSASLAGFQAAQVPAGEGAASPVIMTEGVDEENKTYPPARFTHEQVVGSRSLFDQALREIHILLGPSGERVPKVGGSQLDLHRLYCNVTSLGGCERVIQRKQWREAAESFNFPSTITSVSFSLRRAYNTFLWDFEQVYFHRNTGARVPPPPAQHIPKAARHLAEQHRQSSAVAAAAAMMAGTSTAAGVEAESPVPDQPSAKRPRSDVVATEFPALTPGTPTALTAMAVQGTPLAEAHAALVGTRGAVTVDSRFDAGYFVSVKVGKQEFKGVLYCPPADKTIVPPPPPAAAAVPAVKQDTPAKPAPIQKPRTNKTPFNFFAVDARHKARQLNPNLSQQELTKKVADMWQRATDLDKAPFVALSTQDKARYQAELEAYNYKLASAAAETRALSASASVTRASEVLTTHTLIPYRLYVETGICDQDAAAAALARETEASAQTAAAVAAANPNSVQTVPLPQQYALMQLQQQLMGVGLLPGFNIQGMLQMPVHDPAMVSAATGASDEMGG